MFDFARIAVIQVMDEDFATVWGRAHEIILIPSTYWEYRLIHNAPGEEW